MGEKYAFLHAFNSRDDLKKYGSEALAMFGLQLKFSVEDIHSVAAESITDGPNDKKCDVIYLDRELGVVVLAQSFYTGKEGVKTAKGNKAADLNTAFNWLLLASDENLPDIIKPRALEVRDAIKEGIINKFEIWYIHNCPESENISEELKTVELSAKAHMNAFMVENELIQEIKVEASEIGLNKLERLYRSSENNILVTDKFKISTTGGYHEKSSEWEVYSCNVPASWIYKIYGEYSDDLYSANVRGYLGSRKSSANINHNIKKSVKETPGNFLVYNNGITALVNSMKIGRRQSRKGEVIQTIHINGLSIVNGAQTTGAIGNSGEIPSKEAKVPVRFIACENKNVVENIIKFNNSQNDVIPSDFRSNDEIQKKLRSEFEVYDVTYLGGRRGGDSDVIPRHRNLLAFDRVAQALMAFHGDPVSATHKKSEIWERNELYSKIFNDDTSASHIMFVFSLYQALLSYKKKLRLKKSSNQLLENEITLLNNLSHSGSIYIIMSIISASMDLMLDQKIVNLFDMSFKNETRKSLSHYESIWSNILEACISFTDEGTSQVVNGNLKKADVLKDATQEFIRLVSATKAVNKPIYEEFKKNVDTLKRVTSPV
ncbi:AIPR family protein [Bacillus safensis]|uniref:AIPR family protein n=1 Tax=Bacillus safensis TaxID=561879 RepID=UPI00228229DD|nr:AIPR family protein [Bacillus safensis]MCY7471800.1 AIPR family protein [Bacillus safensis]MEC1076868.1 AIPR family protein [Bacillus safensis]